MFLTSTLLAHTLLASVVVAVPSSSARRIATRKEGSIGSHPPVYVEEPSTHGPKPSSDGSAEEVFTTNWAGAVYDTYPTGSFQSVTGIFTVPTITVPDGDSPGLYGATAWVGIDGASCDVILQTGVDAMIDGANGSPITYNAWYEWWPANWIDFTGIDIEAGDVISATVNVTSSTSGIATIENLTRGQVVSASLSSSTPLCQENAEWIMEDFTWDGTQIPFANFSDITFVNTWATLTSGATITASGADTYNIVQNNEVVTSVTISGDPNHGIFIEYIGN